MSKESKDLDHQHNDYEFDGFTMEDIQKNFKNLADELEDGGKPLSQLVNQAETREQRAEVDQPPYFRGYNPTVKDYLARASTRDECEEIIEYCLSQGEISEEEAETLRYRLERGGPRAFGVRKPGYYDKKL